MDILIKRNYRTTEVIDGQLFIDGSFCLCDTSENATTALPAGQYRVSIIKCKQHARKMPVILFTRMLFQVVINAILWTLSITTQRCLCSVRRSAWVMELITVLMELS